MTKTTRRRRTPPRAAEPDRGTPADAPARQRSPRLPMQAQPVLRAVMRDPFNFAVDRSDSACLQRCLAGCRAKGGPLQSVCESLCATACSR